MRRTCTALLGLVVLATVSGCATMNVSSHVESGISFDKYVTYDWGPPDNLPVGDPRLDNNPFFRDHLMGAIEKKLVAKGYERAVGGQPDLLIHYHANVSQRLDVYRADAQYGYCYGNCEPQIADYDQGTLVIDLVDAGTKRVIWRGWAQDTMNGIINDQQRLDKQVDEAVAKMMLRLPRGGATLR